jgi:transcriptional regulator with XRE-family HTH domain
MNRGRGRPAAPARGGGRLVRRIRSSLGITQAQLAKMIGCVGSTVHRWEAGRCPIPPSRIDSMLLILFDANASPKLIAEARRARG